MNPMETLCANCGVREGTENWVGEGGGMLDYIHGFYQKWCKHCCLEASIGHCLKAAERLPALREELRLLTDAE